MGSRWDEALCGWRCCRRHWLTDPTCVLPSTASCALLASFCFALAVLFLSRLVCVGFWCEEYFNLHATASQHTGTHRYSRYHTQLSVAMGWPRTNTKPNFFMQSKKSRAHTICVCFSQVKPHSLSIHSVTACPNSIFPSQHRPRGTPCECIDQAAGSRRDGDSTQ